MLMILMVVIVLFEFEADINNTEALVIIWFAVLSLDKLWNAMLTGRVTSRSPLSLCVSLFLSPPSVSSSHCVLSAFLSPLAPLRSSSTPRPPTGQCVYGSAIRLRPPCDPPNPQFRPKAAC